jgi:hypothetical protein
MLKPRQHLCHALDPQPLGQFWPRDHDDGNAELTRSLDLGARAIAARIARHQPCDVARLDQGAVALERERPARDDDTGIGQGQGGFGRVDKSQGVGVLRLGGEWRNMLTADGEEDVAALFGQGRDRRSEIFDLDPVVARYLAPWRSLQRHQRRSRCRAGADRVAADLFGKGMRGVDHMRDLLAADEITKPIDTAKTADPHWQRVSERNLRAPGIAIDRVDFSVRERICKPIGLTRSAENEGAYHG